LGTPGLGKSRLLAELVGTLEFRFVRVQAYETATEVALGASGILLRELARVPEIGERLDALLVGDAGTAMSADSIRLFETAFRCVLRMAPLAIVADDLQWIDRQTLALLLYLITAAVSAGTPLFVLVAGRPSPESSTFSAQLAAAFPADRFAQIELQPLEERAGIDLLAALVPGVTKDRAADLWRRASGSPFWLTAFAGDMASGDVQAPSLQHLMQSRRAQLAADPAALFALLLVAAQPLGIDAIGEILDWPDARVSSAVLVLVNRALVLRDGGLVAIAHDLIREAALPELGEAERLRMHKGLARWLEASAADDVGGLLRALEQQVASGLDPNNLALRIARSPQRRLIGDGGLRMLARIADGDSGVEGQDLQKEIAALAFEVGDWAAAFERWSVLADRLVSGPERAWAALAAGAAAFKLGRPFDMHSCAASARAAGKGDQPVEIEADCLDVEALLWLEGRVAEAQPLVERALAASQSLADQAGGISQLGDRESAAYVRALRAQLDAAIRRADAGTVRRCADLIQQAARDPAEVLAAASDSVFSMLQFEGLPRSAEPRAKRALEESRRLTMPGLEVEATHWVGWISHHLGRLDEASTVMHQAIALAERVGAPRRFTLPQLRAVAHGIEASRTDWQSNVDAIEQLIAAESDAHFRLVIRTIHIGLVGRFTIAGSHPLEAWIGDMAADADVAGCGRCLWDSVLASAEALARIGPAVAAEDELRRWDASHPDPAPGGPAARRDYVDALITARRDPQESIALLAKASREADEVGYRLMRLWVDLDKAAALAHIDPPRGVEAFKYAALEAEEMGAKSERGLAVAGLRGLGVRTWRRGPTTAIAELSEREREIAEAVARGATNPEIAGSLFLSRKTVERHVSHILAKLGARNRAELAAILSQKGEGATG
jgi:DNA-binding CsgD family transcriptional regulator